MLADPPSGTIPSRLFRPYPAGSRAFYCFDRLTSVGTGQPLPLGLGGCEAGIPDAHERRRKWRSLELIVPAANERVGRTLWISGVSELLIVHESTDFRQIQL